MARATEHRRIDNTGNRGAGMSALAAVVSLDGHALSIIADRAYALCHELTLMTFYNILCVSLYSK